MWSPTHIQVTVQRAKNLRIKGRGGTNDAFVTIQMGKEKYQTTVKEKSSDPEWYEECDFAIPRKETDIILTAFHQSMLGLDEFLGQILIPTQQLESSSRPVNKWYSLKGRAGKVDEKYRGEIEVCVAFVVRSYDTPDTQSLSEFPVAKDRRRTLKQFATSVGHKIQKMPSRNFSFKTENFDPRARLAKLRMKKHGLSNTDVSVDSSQDYNESESSINDSELDLRHIPMRPARKYNSIYTMKKMTKKLVFSEENNSKSVNHNEWTNRLTSHMKVLARSEMNLSDMTRGDKPSLHEKRGPLESIKNTFRRHTLQLAEPPDLSSLKIVSNNNNNNTKRNSQIDTNSPLAIENLPNLLKDIPSEVLNQYDTMNHKDLVVLAVQQQSEIEKLRSKISDIEAYLDNLLLRVMETTPRILQKPYKPVNLACSR